MLTVERLTPPADPDEVTVWLRSVEDEIAAKMRAAMRRIVRPALEAWAGSLTAAGDASALDAVDTLWGEFVLNDVGDAVGGMHLAGSLSAFTMSPHAVPPMFGERWAAVVNERAVAYTDTAVNRVRGASDATFAHIRAETAGGIWSGASNEEIKDGIERMTGYSEERADTIARTETMAAYNGGNYVGNEALGDYGPLEKVWTAALDARTRQSHADAHDQCVPYDQPFTVGGDSMLRPHDPAGPAREVVNCRCVLRSLYEGDTRPDGSEVIGVEALIRELETNEGFTFDPIHGRLIEHGVPVGIPGYSKHFDADDFLHGDHVRSREELRAYVRRMREDGLGDHTAIGGWYDKDHGEVIFDRVDVFDNRAAGVAAGRERGEIAVFDLDTHETIPTGGTGRVLADIDAPKPPQVRAPDSPRAGSRASPVTRYGAEHAPQARQQLTDALNRAGDGFVQTRVDTEGMRGILNDGRWRSQHETGTSHGSYMPQGRHDHEIEMFGDMDYNPIYGSLNTTSDTSGLFSNARRDPAEFYGDMRVGFRSDVIDRTTVTFGDSLNIEDPPAPIPLRLIPGATDERVAEAWANRWTTWDDIQRGDIYIEAQIHGTLTVDDIAWVDVSGMYRNRDEWVRLLTARGITVIGGG